MARTDWSAFLNAWARSSAIGMFDIVTRYEREVRMGGSQEMEDDGIENQEGEGVCIHATA